MADGRINPNIISHQTYVQGGPGASQSSRNSAGSTRDEDSFGSAPDTDTQFCLFTAADDDDAPSTRSITPQLRGRVLRDAILPLLNNLEIGRNQEEFRPSIRTIRTRFNQCTFTVSELAGYITFLERVRDANPGGEAQRIRRLQAIRLRDALIAIRDQTQPAQSGGPSGTASASSSRGTRARAGRRGSTGR